VSFFGINILRIFLNSQNPLHFPPASDQIKSDEVQRPTDRGIIKSIEVWMQLVINSYGAYLRKSGNCFLVKREDKSFEIAVGKVSSILITTAACITTDAIKLAVDNNIDIVFLDAYGDPYGRVWHPKLGSTTLIRRRQLELYDTPEGLGLAKEWGLKKLDNQAELLARLRKTREEKRTELDRCIEEISQSRERMGRLRGTVDARRQDMLGLEGWASRAYFEAISMVMPEKYRFAGRSRNPARASSKKTRIETWGDGLIIRQCRGGLSANSTKIRIETRPRLSGPDLG
jgi:hypothetical protein